LPLVIQIIFGISHIEVTWKLPRTFGSKTIIYSPVVIKCSCLHQSLWNCILLNNIRCWKWLLPASMHNWTQCCKFSNACSQQEWLQFPVKCLIGSLMVWDLFVMTFTFSRPCRRMSGGHTHGDLLSQRSCEITWIGNQVEQSTAVRGDRMQFRKQWGMHLQQLITIDA
jgi:hypothetical protein